MLGDLRYAVRALWRRPGFAAVAILTLALGIGANTATYSLVQGLLWRPLPFPEPDQLVVLHGASPSRGIADAEVSYADLRDLRQQSDVLTGLAALAQRQAALVSPEGAERVTGWTADPALFEVMGTAALLGRPLRAIDASPQATPVIVLSEGFWARRFGRSPAIVGSVIPVNGVGHTVVGVMPASFSFVRGDVWLPLVPDPAETRDERYFVGLGRLRPGVDVAEARSQLAAVAGRLAEAHPATNRGWGIELARYRDDVVDASGRRALAMMLIAVALVLLIACANVAGLMLARATGRARELAVRAAVGASRGRLARHLLAESAVLAAAGAVLGLVLAAWWGDLLIRSLPGEDVPPWFTPSLDGVTLAATLGAALAATLLSGIVPALRASRPSVMDTLRTGTATSGLGRLRSGLVVAQVSLALVLLAGASLFAQGFLAVRRGDLGFDDRRLLTARVFFGALPQRADRVTWMQSALTSVRGVAGVTAAALTGPIPGDDGGDHRSLLADGVPVTPGDEPVVSVIPSSDGYFEALGMTLVAGRGFTSAEAMDRSAPVAVIGASLAERLWPGADPLGRRVRILPDTGWLTIVGVAPRVQLEEFGEDEARDRLQLHVPFAREPWRSAALMVRTGGAPAAAGGPVRRAVVAADGRVPIFDVMTMAEVRSYTTAGDRIWLLIFGTFGLQALVMAAVGLYGLLAYAVDLRAREIGVRMALGARASLVLALVLRQAALLVAIGLAVGLVGAVAVARVLRAEVWGVEGTLTPVAAAAVILLVTGLAAAALPARRAARVDPVDVLRGD